MDDQEWLAQSFESHRERLRGVAYRMLGSLHEADDAVQEGWLRLSRSGAEGIENLGGWLTTVVARVCLDMLRARKSRGEEAEDARGATRDHTAHDAEQEALLADSVGLAMMVVLDTLEPAERLAFVLHDLFAVPFDEIGRILDRSSMAARQLASRARRRVQGRAPKSDAAGFRRQREVVDAFLAAARRGDFEALLALLDPNVVARSDRFVPGGAAEVRDARVIAERALRGGARAARLASIDGMAGAVVAPRGRLLMVLRFTIENDRITAIDAIADPEQLRQLPLGIIES